MTAVYNPTVLVAEDDRMTMELMLNILKIMGVVSLGKRPTVQMP
jgi:hypothetical protein